MPPTKKGKHEKSGSARPLASADAKAEETTGPSSKHAAAAAPAKSEAPLSDRKRRRSSAGAENAVADAGEASEAPKKAKKGNPPSLTVFVGQLAYTTTEGDVRAHFAAAPGMSEGAMSVRMLSEKGSGKPRGMAFVQLPCEGDVHTALKALHKSMLGGRRINVERTVGGGGAAPTRIEKIHKLRTIQDASINRRVQSLVDAVVAEFGGDEGADEEPRGVHETMGLYASDVDERVREFLSTVSEDIAREALRDFAESPASRVQNRSAYLMGVLQRFVAERKEEENAKKGGKKGGSGGGGRGGGGDWGGGGRGGGDRGGGGRGGGGRGGGDRAGGGRGGGGRGGGGRGGGGRGGGGGRSGGGGRGDRGGGDSRGRNSWQ